MGGSKWGGGWFFYPGPGRLGKIRSRLGSFLRDFFFPAPAPSCLAAWSVEKKYCYKKQWGNGTGWFVDYDNEERGFFRRSLVERARGVEGGFGKFLQTTVIFGA